MNAFNVWHFSRSRRHLPRGCASARRYATATASPTSKARAIQIERSNFNFKFLAVTEWQTVIHC